MVNRHGRRGLGDEVDPGGGADRGRIGLADRRGRAQCSWSPSQRRSTTKTIMPMMMTDAVCGEIDAMMIHARRERERR